MPGTRSIAFLKQISVHSLLPAVVFFFTFLVFFFHQDIITMSAFQSRDLSRALGILDGQLIWHGPETSQFTKLPGPFFYFLMALPLSILPSWKSVWLLMIALNSIGAAIFFSYLRTASGYIAAFFGWYLLLTNRILISNMDAVWNPSFLPIFAFGALYCFHAAFTENKARTPTIVFFTVVALACQFHFSAALWIPAFLLTKIFVQRKKKLPQPNWQSIGWGLLILGGMWTLFFILSDLNGISFFGVEIQDPGVSARPFDLERTTRNFLAILRTLGSSYEGSINWILTIILAVSIWSTTKSWFRAELGPVYLLIIPLIVFLLMPVTKVGAELVPFRIRYLFHFAAVSLVIFPHFLQSLSRRVLERSSFKIDTTLKRRFALAMPFAATILVFGFAMADLQKLKAAPTNRTYNLLTVLETEYAMREVARITGWTYEEARYRVYFLNQHLPLLPEIVYDEQRTALATSALSAIRDLKVPDGIFLARVETNAALKNKDFFLDWVKRTDIEPVLLDEINSGKILIHDSIVSDGRIVVVPYSFANSSSLPRLVHNSGQPFDFEASPPPKEERFFAKSNLKFADRFDTCKTGYSPCETTVSFAIDNHDGPSQIEIGFHGELISRPKFIALYDAGGFRNLHLSLRCSGRDVRFELAKKLGYMNEGGRNLMRNDFFLSPVKWTFPLACRGPIESMQLGWSGFIRTFDGQSSDLGEGVRSYR